MAFTPRLAHHGNARGVRHGESRWVQRSNRLAAAWISTGTWPRTTSRSTYQVSAQGREITDRYALFRKELLISMTRAAAGNLDFETLARALTMMSAIYDQASCVAATHRVPL